MVDMLGEATNRVAAAEMPRARLTELEQLVGINFNPHGLLADRELRAHCDPIGILTYDWVHTMLADGVFTVEVQAFLKSCEPLGILRRDVHDWLKDPGWRFPLFQRDKCKDLHRVFDEHRLSASNPDRLKCNCAELLGLYGLLRHWVEVRVGSRDEVRPQRASFDAACQVLDLLMIAKRQLALPGVTAAQLQQSVSRFLTLHKEAYGTQHLRPKHHWLMDIPQQVARDSAVVDAFVIERQHLLVKGVAEHVDNTTTYERSVMSSVCTLVYNADDAWCDGLRGTSVGWPGLPGVMLADKLRIFGTDVAIDDLVFRGDAVGYVLGCAAENMRLFVIVDVLTRAARVTGTADAFALAGHQELWPADELVQCLAWYGRPDGAWVVIRM